MDGVLHFNGDEQRRLGELGLDLRARRAVELALERDEDLDDVRVVEELVLRNGLEGLLVLEAGRLNLTRQLLRQGHGRHLLAGLPPPLGVAMPIVIALLTLDLL